MIKNTLEKTMGWKSKLQKRERKEAKREFEKACKGGEEVNKENTFRKYIKAQKEQGK